MTADVLDKECKAMTMTEHLRDTLREILNEKEQRLIDLKHFKGQDSIAGREYEHHAAHVRRINDSLGVRKFSVYTQQINHDKFDVFAISREDAVEKARELWRRQYGFEVREVEEHDR